MVDIDLGFPEERDNAWLTNRYFPSKVGGRPAWLELSALPENVECEKCKGPKTFLCQIYAPFEEEHAFHRTLFVFVCRSNECQIVNSARNLTVLRNQLPLKNQFYSLEPPAEDGKALPAIPTKRKLCIACGCVGPLSCSRCKNVNYCSTQHQRAHWPHHRKVCAAKSESVSGNETAPISLPQVLFPEWEIVIEANEQEATSTKCRGIIDEQKQLAEFEKLEVAGKTGAFKDVPVSELDKYAQSAEEVNDKYFRKFKKEINKDPEQILRYKRHGNALWIADVERTFTEEQLQIPKCENCGAERQFEFQIMPQMLLLLKDEQLDWGVLAIYTCERSCEPAAGVGYLKEYIVKQDIITDNK